jgi:hypothetical protein
MADIWSSLEQFINPATVMAEWRAGLGADYTNTLPLLWSNGDQAKEYPCTNNPSCGCDHEIIVHAQDRIVAACRCDPAECKTINLQPRDVLIFALDSRKFCRAIRTAFNFYAPQDERATPYGAPHAWPVGAYGALHSPVYLIIRQSEREFMKEVEGLIAGQAGPFILLAPTKIHHTHTVHAVLQSQKAIFIPLSCALTFDGPGRFKMTNPIQPILDRFTMQLSEGTDTGKMLQGIHREIAAVRTEYHDLKTAKARLEQMVTEGLFAFTKNVDSRSFKIFCTILADGDVAKASRTLNMGDSTLRDDLKSWRGKGKAYQNMLDLVRWRKKIGRTGKVPLNDAILHEKTSNANYPALLSDVLDGLLSMTGNNWQDICDELSDLLRPHVPR